MWPPNIQSLPPPPSDLNIGISDGKYFICMHIYIPDDYGANYTPCWLIEENSNTAILTNSHLTNGSTGTPTYVNVIPVK